MERRLEFRGEVCGESEFSSDSSVRLSDVMVAPSLSLCSRGTVVPILRLNLVPLDATSSQSSSESAPLPSDDTVLPLLLVPCVFVCCGDGKGFFDRGVS